MNLEESIIHDLEVEVEQRRHRVDIISRGFCTNCKSEKKNIVFSIGSGDAECEECYARRRYEEMQEFEKIKEVKVKKIRNYFAVRKALFTCPSSRIDL